MSERITRLKVIYSLARLRRRLHVDLADLRVALDALDRIEQTQVEIAKQWTTTLRLVKDEEPAK